MSDTKRIFNVAFELNNYPERGHQQTRLFHDISEDYDEQKLLQVNQTHYFETLVNKRIIFQRDTEAQIKTRQEEAIKEYRKEHGFDIRAFGMFGDTDDYYLQKIKDVPAGYFRILTLEELYRLEAEEKQRQMHHESDEVSEERSDLEEEWAHVVRENGLDGDIIDIED